MEKGDYRQTDRQRVGLTLGGQAEFNPSTWLRVVYHVMAAILHASGTAMMYHPELKYGSGI